MEADRIKLRDSFKAGPFGILKFSFSETEMKIEARMNKTVIFTTFGTILGLALIISLGLALGFSEWAFLAIMIIPILITPLGFLEINERITIDSSGVTSSGVVWPRPCKLSWSEIEKIDVTETTIMFLKNEKEKVLIPVASEVLFIVDNYRQKKID